MIKVNEAALKEAIDLIGLALGKPNLNEAVLEVYRRLDKAEERGETRGYKNGYQTAQADAKAVEYYNSVVDKVDAFNDSFAPAPKELNDPTVINAAAAFDDFPFPSEEDFFYEGDSGDENHICPGCGQDPCTQLG